MEGEILSTKPNIETQTSPAPSLPTFPTGKTISIYVTVSILWIFFFDQFWTYWFSDSTLPVFSKNAQTLAFSAGTAIFLFFVLRKTNLLPQKLADMENENRKLTESTRQDLLERELVEQALRGSRTRYQQLFEHMLGGFSYQQILTDDAGHPVDFVFMEINSAFETILNCNRAQIIGQRVTKFFPQIRTSNPDLIQLFGHVALTGQDNRFEYYWGDKRRWFSVAVFSPQEGYFVTLFEDITNHKDSESKLRIHSEYLLSLNELTLGLLNRVNLDELLSVMVARATSLLDHSSGSLYLPCEDGLHVKLVAASGFYSDCIGLVHRKDCGLVHQVLETGAPVVLKDYRDWENRLDFKEFETTRAIVGLPIFADGKVYGVLEVQFHQPDRLFNAEEVELLDRFARLASIALDNALLYKRSLTEIQERQLVEEQLKHMALHDGLTKLYNRSYFEEELHRLEMRRSGSVGVIVCDVDGLKLVNDTLGHAVGDQLLISVANILRQGFRDSDMVARIGGDEFVILLPGALPEVIEKGIDRIRTSVIQANKDSEKSLISLSAGWAVSLAPSDSLSLAFKEADTNMYREKLHQSRSNKNAMVKTLIQSMENKDYLTDGHADRLQFASVEMASAMQLPDKSITNIRLLAKFHDLGKVGIPDTLLNKEGTLTEADINELRRHPEIGFRIAQVSTELLPIADFILKHHEWWNGKGYPFGLAGEAIPVECRILSIADAFDAMTSNRPYRAPLSIEAAYAELKRCAGTQFDPAIVELFLALRSKL